ncbi:cadherin-like domain-containing protein [Thioclava sp. A2]|uniref:Ig-like domain-containing protein n=1 Tax=Thioclava sp. FCG-A2 TaxID=3080562 RepID=UPI002952B54D|nr:cadherin-like domain-containing protein [Thioclava sp. A2]MDV7269904.1 cadherin-like domain-containing protein [Thioclava sp. A2]
MTYYYNSAPDARNDSATTNYNSPVTVCVLANDYDPNCDWLKVTSVSGCADGTVKINSDGSVTFTPNAGFSGTTSFTYTISDGRGGYDTATVTIKVCDPPNDGIVSGTTGDDLIDYAYTGDPDGDRVDHNDAILPGEYGDDDIIKAGSGNDTILAGAGNDDVYAGTGNDLIDGGAGNDSLRGEAGDDTFVGGAGNDTFDGGAGLDMIDYSASGAGVNINLQTSTLTGGDATGDVIVNGVDGIYGSAYNDTLVGFDHEGTDPADTFTNVFYGGAGNDYIDGRGGDDSLVGGADDDTILGGTGNDTIHGDGTEAGVSGAGEALTVDWAKFAAAGCSINNGTSVDMGGVSVTYGFTAQDYGANATVSNDTQYTEAGDGFSGAGGLRLYGCGGEGGVDNTSTTTLNFASTDPLYGDEVQNVSFRLNDLDIGTSSDFHIDIVTIRAYDADGNPVAVSFTPEGGQTISGNTITSHDVDYGGTLNPSNAAGSVLVNIAGPVARIEIDYDNGGDTDQAIWVTDIAVETTDGAAAVDAAGDDLIDAGEGDDVIFGDAGADTITGGAGADAIDGGDDRDVIFGGAGDTVDGGEGGDDWDTLDLTGAGPVNVIYSGADENGNGYNGTVEFLDNNGAVVGTLDFANIESIIHDDYDPNAVDDMASTDEDTAVIIDVLANDTHPEGDTLTVTGASSPDGSVTINADGTLTFTPAPDFNGTTTISYTVTDGNGDTDTATVNVTVNPVNDAPVANDDAATTAYQTAVVINVLGNDTDVDGDTLSVVSASSPNGTVTINADGTLTFTPAPGFEGDATITYTVTDPGGLTDTATVTVTVDEQPLDGIVEGTAGADLIDNAYTGDPEGDMVDHLDEILPGEGPNDDIIQAGAGNDTVYAGAGNDEVYGEDGDDALYGGAGDDYMSGGNGDDTLYGGAGNDTLDAGQDGDALYGEDGDDRLLGGPREDLLDGGAGNDTVIGGNAADTIVGGDGRDLVEGNDGNDLIDTSATGTPLPDLAYPGLWSADSDPNDDRDTVYGGAGNDTITTGDDADYVDGGTGNDVINSGIDADTVYGGTGDDLITSGEGSDIVDGGDGNDTIYGGVGPGYPDAINIPDATDLVQNNGMDTIHGGAGNDVIYGEDDDDQIYGDAGDDYIDGGIDEDTIDGGTGNDTILGGAGADVLSGGDDRDTFIVSSAEAGTGDTIDGNEGGDDWDTLDLSAVGKAFTNVIYDSTNPENGTVEFLDGAGNVTGTLSFSNIENVVPCFTPGTLIATPKGERLVEELKVGDKVMTRDNGVQEIRWMGRRDLTHAELLAAPHLKPVMIKAGSLGDGLPERDMLVSPNHRMLVANDKTALYFEEHEVLVASKHLVNNAGIRSVETLGTSYLHFMFDHHEVVLANGTWSESFQPGDQTLGGMGNAQRSEIFEIFPELKDSKGREDYQAARKTLKKYEARLLQK